MDQLPPTRMLLLGDFDTPAVKDALRELEASDLFRTADRRSVKAIDHAFELLNSGEFDPAIVLAYQGIPDEFPASDIERLIGQLPLCRFVVMFGPWCESIGRTEQRWPVAWCVPLRNAPGRLRCEFGEFSGGSPPAPATASRDEAFARFAVNRLASAGRPGVGKTASVLSADAAQKDCVQATLESLGFGIKAAGEVDLSVFVSTLIDDTIVCGVKEFREQFPARRLLIASDMVTPDQQAALITAGASAVVSQLRFAEDVVDYVLDWLPEDGDSCPSPG